ncbi:hypothetical protein V6N13_004423 [Hibiscus sabdariffa]
MSDVAQRKANREVELILNLSTMRSDIGKLSLTSEIIERNKRGGVSKIGSIVPSYLNLRLSSSTPHGFHPNPWQLPENIHSPASLNVSHRFRPSLLFGGTGTGTTL